jgi:hypothetical protein
MDLPCDEDPAGLPEYAGAVIDAIGDRRDLVLVAQSFRALERLGITPDESDGGHWIALSRRKELTDRLHSFLS